MRSKTLRQLFGAVAIAVTAATMHGAWFATTDAREAAPTLIVSTWDYYEKSWIEAPLDLGATTPSLRHSEDTIVAITGATALSFPAELNTIAIDGQGGRPSLASLEIPPAPAADASTTYLHLLVSKPANLAGSWPVLDPETPWTGPIDPTDDDLGALDVEGSVGVHTVTATVGAAPHDFTWDIGRWSKGDIFLGLNNHTYKVLDRNGNLKRFVASADYDEYQNGFTDDYNVTTGCATNWKTGEVFATNFGDYYPAVNIIGRHPVDSDLSPYSQASRRVVTRIDRTDDDQQAGYVNPYTGVNYPIDSSPESVAFDADMNMYVGHSFGNFRQAPAAWQGSADKLFEYDDEWTEYTMAVDGLPLEGWTWNDGWGYVVDETGVRMLLAPAGSPVGAFGVKQYGVEVSPRLSYVTDGQGLPTGLAMSTAGVLYPTAVPLPGWSADMALPQSFLSDPSTGTALYRLDGLGGIVESLIPSRWSIGKRLHKYFLQNGAYEATDAARDEFWTFSGRQGTDWIDLDVTGEVMYYSSEDSFIHRYRVKPGPNGEPGGQLPDVGYDLAIEGQPTFGKLAVAQNVAQGMSGGLLGDYRFHGMRILPPGDGTGGFLVAVENGLGVHRFSAEGKWLQRYYAHIDRDGLASTGTDGKEYLIGKWYTIEVDPGGQTFWASAHDSGWVFQFDIATGRILKQIEAVDYLVPNADPQVPEGRRVEGICIMWEYTAPQEICFVNGQPEGTDNDGDGYIDENCVAIEVCSVVSPGDDDGDGLGDQYDSDCAAEMPPVAIDDAYAMRQREFAPNPTVLSVGAADGVLKRGAVDDYDRDRETSSTSALFMA